MLCGFGGRIFALLGDQNNYEMLVMHGGNQEKRESGSLPPKNLLEACPLERRKTPLSKTEYGLF